MEAGMIVVGSLMLCEEHVVVLRLQQFELEMK